MTPETKAQLARKRAYLAAKNAEERRDYFAALAMQGLLTSSECLAAPSWRGDLHRIAKLAYQQADAMEAARGAAAPIAAPCPDCGQPLAQCECEEG